MVTVFATGSGPGAPQEIQLDGTTGADGVRWFRRLRIWRDGKPYFDLTLRRFQPLKALVDPLLEGPNAESSRGTDKR